jgi:hypothetical protein
MPALPSVPLASEANYVRQLLDAYGDHLNSTVATESDLHQQPDLFDHFRDARLEFYSAESLRAFSRDTLPPNEFERLQDEIHSGIKDELRSDYQSGYRRVIAVVRTARCLHPSGHSLYSRLSIRDYGGICHQLANDKKVRWIK